MAKNLVQNLSRAATLRQLEILATVYRLGSIKAASEFLHLTQPTVSMQLKKLSESVGMSLYQMIGRKLTFTDSGREIAQSATRIFGELGALEMRLADLRGLKAGALRLSVVTTSKYFIPHMLGPFCERYPGIDIQLNVGNRRQIIERLEKGGDDFYVFSHPPEDVDTVSTEFLLNPLVAIAPASHPLARKRRISLAQLAQEPFLMREQGSGTRFAIEQFLQKHRLKLNVKMTIESNEAIKHAVMSGLGISILSAHTLTFGGNAGLVELRVEKLPITTSWHMVWPKSKSLSPIADRFLQYVHDEGRQLIESEFRRTGLVTKQLR
ncbi:LysR family transcriptional regulator [Litorivivens sp.]|uniref:LysR family transcriptional regulator n=1 Tax=Litorivivens sp. TaxID=2020868 RepID=UPI00356B1EF6